MRRPDGTWRSQAAALAAAAALLVSAVSVQAWRERAYPTMSPLDSVLYIRSGALLKRMSLSFDALAADVYWVRAIQHFGGTRRSAGAKRYELLYPLLDITTTLDPRFTLAYRFGAIFLAEPPPGGPGRADQAISLLEKGIRASPTRWEYLHDVGFVHYWWRRDYQTAAAWFDKAAAIPGAPWWLRSFAATTLAQGGDRRASRALWQMMYETAEIEWLRNDAARRLMQLDAMDQIDALERLVAVYKSRDGVPPYSWDALVRRGFLRGVPRDPAGVVYYLGPYAGDVDLGDESPLAPLPAEPPPTPRPEP